jgi:hypothetical protein
MLLRSSEEAIPAANDRADVRRRYEALAAAAGRPSEAPVRRE